MAHNLTAKLLNNSEIEFLKDKIESILTKKGVAIENHPEGLERLKKAGADVSGARVRFPKALIEESLKQVPKQFILAAIDPKWDMVYPHPNGLFYTRTCTGGMYYLSETLEYHHITIEEVAEWTRLTNTLEHINFWSLPSTKPIDFPSETIDIHTLNTVFRNTTKHGWLQPYEQKNIKYLIDLASVVAGGKEQLRKRPIVSFISCATPSLTFKPMDVEVILQSALNGIPLQPCSLPTAGANAPITPQGIVLLSCAEVLAQIIMLQLFVPGTACIATPLLFEMDMKTTNTGQASMSTTMGRMAAMQLFEDGYGIPAHTYGTGTDSLLVDAQAGIEASSLAHMVALSGASVLGGAGQIETAKTINPQQLIIDNDIFGMIRQLKAGFEVNMETSAFDEIMGLTGKESFIDMDHTFRHFRDSYRPRSFVRDSKTNWVSKGRKDIIARATEIYYKVKENYEPVTLPDEILVEMESIVKKADFELGR